MTNCHHSMNITLLLAIHARCFILLLVILALCTLQVMSSAALAVSLLVHKWITKAFLLQKFEYLCRISAKQLMFGNYMYVAN